MSTTLHYLAEAHNARFGTSGVRGLVADLTDAVCYAYAQAFLRSVAAASPRIVVGHDLRPSSPRIAAACIQAIRDAGTTEIHEQTEAERAAWVEALPKDGKRVEKRMQVIVDDKGNKTVIEDDGLPPPAPPAPPKGG